MVKRKQAVDIRKNEIAQKIEEALRGFRAGRCDDDTRVVKVPVVIQWACNGERIDEPTEFEVYIKEIHG